MLFRSNNDANNLTKSGTVNPAVDFHHLQEVLVIRTLKEYIPSEGEVPEESTVSGQGSTPLTAPRAEDAAKAAQDQESQNGENQNPDEAAQPAAEGGPENAEGGEQANAEGGEQANAEGGQENAEGGAPAPEGGEQ